MKEYFKIANLHEWNWFMKKIEVVNPNARFRNFWLERKPTELKMQAAFFQAKDVILRISGDDLDFDTLTLFKRLDNDWDGNYFDVGKLMATKNKATAKYKMTKKEHEEFCELRESYQTLADVLNAISDFDQVYPVLHKKIYAHTASSIKEFEFEFVRVWKHPSLIEVIPDKKWNVKVPKFDDRFYYKDNGKLNWAYGRYNGDSDQQFTNEELKEYGLDNDLFEKKEVSE